MRAAIVAPRTPSRLPFRALYPHRRMQPQRATPSSVDVAIIGGGPCGLACAHALAKVLPAGSKIALFDKVPDISLPRGAGLRLEINGLKALRAISQQVYDTTLARHAVVPCRSQTRSPSGQVLQDQDLMPGIQASQEKYDGMNSINIGWHELVSTMAELLPPQVQTWPGTRLLRYEESEQGLHLHLQRTEPAASGSDGSKEQDETFVVTAKLLVAADGYFSRVREQCLGDGPPLFDKCMIWRARVEAELATRCGYSPDSVVWYFGANRVLLVYPVGHGHLVWTGSCPQSGLDELGIDYDTIAASRRESSAQSSDYLQRSDANGRASKERLLRAFAGFEQQVLELMAATAPAAIVEQGLHVRPAAGLSAESFGRGRVVIVGDAAHPLRPTGQGTNQALEDALALGQWVQRGGGGFGLLDGFRAARAARVGPIMLHAETQGKAAYRKEAPAPAVAASRIARATPIASPAAATAAEAPTADARCIHEDYEGFMYRGTDFTPLQPSSN